MLVFAGMLHPNADDFLESLIASDNSTALSTLNAVFFYRQMAINITVLSLVTSGTAALTTAFFVMHCHLVTAELMSVFSEMQKYVENGSVWENIQVTWGQKFWVQKRFCTATHLQKTTALSGVVFHSQLAQFILSGRYEYDKCTGAFSAHASVVPKCGGRHGWSLQKDLLSELLCRCTVGGSHCLRPVEPDRLQPFDHGNRYYNHVCLTYSDWSHFYGIRLGPQMGKVEKSLVNLLFRRFRPQITQAVWCKSGDLVKRFADPQLTFSKIITHFLQLFSWRNCRIVSEMNRSRGVRNLTYVGDALAIEIADRSMRKTTLYVALQIFPTSIILFGHWKYLYGRIPLHVLFCRQRSQGAWRTFCRHPETTRSALQTKLV